MDWCSVWRVYATIGYFWALGNSWPNAGSLFRTIVTAWRLSRLVSSIGQAGILDGSYQRQLNKHIGPLDRNCRWTLWKIQDSEPRVFKTDSESREEVSSLYPRKNSHGRHDSRIVNRYTFWQDYKPRTWTPDKKPIVRERSGLQLHIKAQDKRPPVRTWKPSHGP